MSHRVLALYPDREEARRAAGRLETQGIVAFNIRVAEGVAEGSGRVEVAARDSDQAIDVQAFLRLDGSTSVEILPGNEMTIVQDTIPPVPFPRD